MLASIHLRVRCARLVRHVRVPLDILFTEEAAEAAAAEPGAWNGLLHNFFKLGSESFAFGKEIASIVKTKVTHPVVAPSISGSGEDCPVTVHRRREA